MSKESFRDVNKAMRRLISQSQGIYYEDGQWSLGRHETGSAKTQEEVNKTLNNTRKNLERLLEEEGSIKIGTFD